MDSYGSVIKAATPYLYTIVKFIGKGGDLVNMFSKEQKPCLPQISNKIIMLPTQELAKRIRNKQLTSEQVIQAFIDRIKEVQPFLNAIIDERFEAALADARKVDEFLKVTKVTSEELEEKKPYLGVPFTVKDSIKVSGMLWTSGCYRRKGMIAIDDAPVVAKVRNAGGIPLAITNVPELLLWFASSNKLYGRTNNPFDLSRVPGGSSGGEAALISASGSPLSICSDIGGSIRMPAFDCGLFGHKPTSKVLDWHGTFPAIEGGLEEIFSMGPITRYAQDLLPALRVMAGQNYHLFRNIDKPVDFKSIKVFYLDESGNDIALNPEPYIRNAIHKAAFHFATNYGCKVERADLKHFKNIVLWYSVLFSNSQDVASLITENTSRINPYYELMASLIGKSEYSTSALTVAATQGIIRFLYNKKSTPDIYEEAEKSLDLAREEFNSFLGENGIFIYVTLPRVALNHCATAFELGNVCYPMVMNYLRVPATQIPTGLHQGMPYGIQVAASSYNDRLTIAVANELEKVFGGWVSPN